MINKNLYKMELSRYRNSMLIWTAVICGLIILDMAFYRVFVNEGMFDKIKPFLNSQIIAPMMKSMGVELDKLTNVLGFYMIRNTPLVLLLSGIFSINMSTSIFSIEEYEKIAEFTYTRPVTRLEIFTSKILTCFTHILIINVIIILIGFISLEFFKNQDYDRTVYYLDSIYGILCSFSFAAIGFTMASLAKRGRNLFGISIGFVLGTYFLNLISKVSQSSEFVGYVSPFKYVDTNVLVDNFSLNPGYILFFVIVTFVLTFISMRIFLKKDIL